MTNTEVVIQQTLAKGFSSMPFNKLLGVQLDSLDESQIILSLQMRNELVGNFMHGMLHGGVTASILDMAGGLLVMAALIRKHPNSSFEEIAEIVAGSSTVDLNINYLRPGKGESFIAKAWLVKAGNNISFTKMELHNQDDVLIATGSATYFSR